MKSKYKLLTVLLIILFWNCEQTDFDLQTPPDRISTDNTDHDLMITGILDKFGREIQEDYFLTIGRYVRHMALEAEYLPPFGRDRNRFLDHWELIYDNSKNIQFIEAAAETDESLVFHRAIARTIWVFGFANIVDLHGDVPYSEALNPIAYPHPGVDKGEDIYEDLFEILDGALADFEKAIEMQAALTLNQITETADLMYQGDIESWVRMANSLKLRLLVQTRLVNPEFSKTQIDLLLEEDRFITPDYDFQYRFGKASGAFPSDHPAHDDSYLDNFPDYIANHFIYMLKDRRVDEEGESIPDPRIRYYLYRQTGENDLDAVDYCWDPLVNPNLIEGFNYCFLGDNYLGKDHGFRGKVSNDFDDIITIPGAYPVGGVPDNNEGVIRFKTAAPLNGAGINPLILSSFVNFYKAEAALTLGTAGDPEAYLRLGVEESMEKTLNFAELDSGLRPSNSEVEAYVDAVIEAYQAAPTDEDKLGIIIDEFYLAAWGNPLEIYNAYRRTGFPSYPPRINSSVGGGDIGDFPRSLPWPRDIVDNNLSFEGQNKSETVTVFWDTNPQNFIH